ncbi:MAG: DUF188 domain-containing protein [Campylobacterales bacterium]|nr:DUF188 domain-containing protein [Campylobacterales bacterium]MBN2832179.1 DUF188 domain-containing protein [Campylobacterales bacterium]
MTIFVDADAFPNVLKDILLRFVLKRGIRTRFIANKKISIPDVAFISMEIAPQGVDEADHLIAFTCNAKDIVITADIPLADRVVAKGAIGLDPRGTLYTPENIKGLLAMRNLMQELRDGGEITGGPSAIGEKEKRAFADALNALLQKCI